MQHWHNKVFLLTFLLALVVGLSSLPWFVVSPTARAADTYTVFLPLVAKEPDAEDLIDTPIGEEEQLAAEQYWTRDAMLSAEEMSVPTIADSNSLAAVVEEQIASSGPTETVDGTLPDPAIDELAQQLNPEDWSILAAQDEQAFAVDDEELTQRSHGTAAAPQQSIPFIRYCANCVRRTWQTYPQRTMGRLFFTVPGEGRSACSASVARGRTVWTAGHCVYTPGKGWHTNMVFVPAYRVGAAPYGIFRVFKAVTLRGWRVGGWNRSAYDIAMVAVQDRSGRSVANWVGSLGATWNVSRNQSFRSFGYPNNIEQGRYLIACVSRTAVIENLFRPATTGMGCDMTYGASGGPWLLKYASGRIGPYNYVNGVSSYLIPGRRMLFSPYFGSGAQQLYSWGAKQ